MAAEFIQAEGATEGSKIHKLINSTGNKTEMRPTAEGQLLCLSIRVTKKISLIIKAYQIYQIHSKFIKDSSFSSNSVYKQNYWVS